MWKVESGAVPDLTYAWYGFSKLMQRIFRYGSIHNTSVRNPDKVLNILIY